MKRIKRLVAVLLAMLSVCSSAVAAVPSKSGIRVRGVHAVKSEPVMYFEVRMLDSAGRGVSVEQDEVFFTAKEQGVQLGIGEVPEDSHGHIIVVDTSRYYFGSNYIKAANLHEMISLYLSRINQKDRVMFILATDGQPEVIPYKSAADARKYVEEIALTELSSAKMNTAIYTAFQYAVDPSTGNPPFNSVFIIADPDIESNDDKEVSLNDCVTLRSQGNSVFDVTVALPYRKSFVDETSPARRSSLEKGFDEYAMFVNDVGGSYVQVPQSGNGSRAKVETDGLRAAIADRMTTSNFYAVDFSPLAGMLDKNGEQYQTVDVNVSYAGNESTVTVLLNTALLPEPPATPTPTPELTPTPEPTPVVRPGQADTLAMQAIYALNKLNYLHRTDFEAFDNECYIAYVQFCENNGLDPRDGIYSSTYDKLISGDAIPVIEVTPEPTPTPAPTPLVAVGQEDATAMKAVHALYKLNYLEDTSFSKFDNECFIAYMEFCEKNGLDPRDGIYEKGFSALMSDHAIGIERATPEPTATPDPTIPPEGYSINDADNEHSGGFIAQIQAVLKNLNCYEEGVNADVGRMDQATVDAISVYCTTYNWRNDRVDGVTKTLCQEILASGPNLAPRTTPEPTMQEKTREFLMRDLNVFNLQLKMWMPALACVVLLFIILVLIVLFSGGSKEKPEKRNKKEKKEKKQKKTRRESAEDYDVEEEDRKVVTVVAQNPVYEPVESPVSEETLPDDFNDSERTKSGFFAKPVDLRIEFEGSVDTKSIELFEGRPFIIGRQSDCDLVLNAQDKKVSRTHAKLLYEDDQVYLLDVSTYHSTRLNGMEVHGSEHRGMGAMVANGDVITAGTHRITITW